MGAWRPALRAVGVDRPAHPPGDTVPAVFSEAEGLAYIERQLRRQADGEGLPLRSDLKL